MKKLFTTLTFLLLTFCTVEILQAQVTIGSAEPPIEGALLDLKQEGSTRGGLGLPRVALSDMSQLTMGTNAIPNTDMWRSAIGAIECKLPRDRQGYRLERFKYLDYFRL